MRAFSGLTCLLLHFSPLLSPFTSATPVLPLHFLSASLLTCMSSSVLLWLPRKKASPMLDSPLFLAICDQQTVFGTPCFQNKDKVSVDLCRFLPKLFIDSPDSTIPLPRGAVHTEQAPTSEPERMMCTVGGECMWEID